MNKVLIADDVHPVLLEGLNELGYACDYQPDISLEETIQIVDKYRGIVINTKIKADHKLLNRTRDLLFIARLGSGLDIIDLDLAAEKGIQVFSAPEGNCNAVAEHAMGMLLTFANNYMQGDNQVRSFYWDREGNRGFELEGMTIGVIGYGHTGKAFIDKLSGFNVRVLVYDRFEGNMTSGHSYVSFVDLKQVMQESDIISLHVQLNDTSHHMVDAEFIDGCSKNFVLINTSRGKVVRTEDLISGLESGKVKGACLDVFENEKPATFTDYEKSLYSRLYSFKNVVLTPHVAGWTVESKRKISEVLLKKIAVLNKNRPQMQP